MTGLRQQLRAATAPLHEAVDEAFAGFRLDSRTGYVRFLCAHWRAVQPLECCLEQAGIDRLLPDWSQRTRRMALSADLERLEVEPPTPLPAPRITSLEGIWGAVYVLEGSRLGARVLSRRVDCGDRPAPLAYLTQGADRSLWPTFLERLETAGPPAFGAPLLAGAEAAFALFLTAARLERGACRGTLLATP